LIKTLPENLLVSLWKSSRIDFSEVTVHECELPSLLGVPALACGSYLLFAPGCYNPDILHGRRLILHELTHCLQQWSGKLRGQAGLVVDEALESEAHSFGLGAQAIVRPSTTTRKLPFFLPDPLVYQPAIGFEFQTGWKVHRRSTVLHRFSLPEKRDITLPKETVLYGGRHRPIGWSMETDDDEIEFVIEPPIEESADGIVRMEQVFLSLTTFLSRLQQCRNSAEITPKTHPSIFNPDVDSSIVIKPAGLITAQPQITAGVRLGRVPDLFAEMHRLRLESKITLFESHGVNSNYFALQAGKTAEYAANIPAINGVPASNKLRGLIALICQYLIQGSSGGSRAYVKDLAYAMARTDFASMFKELPPAERRWFETDPKRWVDYCLSAAQMPGTGLQKVVHSKITDGPNGPRPGAEILRTRQDWLRDMTMGVDRLTKRGTPGLLADDGTHRLRALGLLGAKFDPVGRIKTDGTRHRGIILEFRQMQRNVPFAMWHGIAHDILRYLIQLNNSHATDVKPQIQTG